MRYSAAPADAIRSTGFRRLASGGAHAPIDAIVRSERVAISIPCSIKKSVHMMAGPPASVTIATRFPRGRGWRANAIA